MIPVKKTSLLAVGLLAALAPARAQDSGMLTR